MKGFNFEKNLPHQQIAVENTIAVFEGMNITKNKNAEVNPKMTASDNFYIPNIQKIQKIQNITEKPKNEKGKDEKDKNIIDIMMETGTGKTYTYTKTIFELNKNYGIFKFVLIVPTLSIKVGTISFLQSDSTRLHFHEQYKKNISLHIVESQKNNKGKKSNIPSAISNFVKAQNIGENGIHVLIINAGMLNSDTMQKSFDTNIFDKYSVPFEAISAINPFVIIDEPHKFGQNNKTWENIQKLKPQFIFRYGATFQEYQNLIYMLTAVQSFNQNLVKGIIGHIIEFKEGKNSVVKFVDSDGKEATFELTDNNKTTKIKITQKESLNKIHEAMNNLFLEKLNKSEIELSNGLVMKKGDKINPYSYAMSLQEIMIQNAIKNHFLLEKEYLTKEVKIKPLTLFFIDNIDEYRQKDGNIRLKVEQQIKIHTENLLKELEIEQKPENEFYIAYLHKTLANIPLTHGGYFSKDNSEKDEIIEKEINEILHDKQEMLNLENPRRFIFSKWTLREGWDNPNVFQICKLRSSGSEISKLQEVGRGLRLPVNQYGHREKDDTFFLHYFVDFTENDFIEKLAHEINKKSNTISIEQNPEKLSDEMIKKICENYHTTEENLLEHLDNQKEKIINRANNFVNNGFKFIQENYPLIFQGVHSNKIRKADDTPKKVKIRTEKYEELKALWEQLNQKAILEYKFKNETHFKTFFTNFLNAKFKEIATKIVYESQKRLDHKSGQSNIVNEPNSAYGSQEINISTMPYSEFLQEISKNLHINFNTIHQAFLETNIDIKINNYMTTATIRSLKQQFDNYLLENATDKFEIGYKYVANEIHPTKFTNQKGNPLTEILSADIGTYFSDENVANNYFLNELYYDSELEKQNIKNEITEIIVFTKIPKNSIKIPIAGGSSYSPDFAYMLKSKEGNQKLCFVVETKNVNADVNLRAEEQQKIAHAQMFFNQNPSSDLKIYFKTQTSSKKILDLINDIYKKE